MSLIIDTNVVLDWLVFRDRACAGFDDRVGTPGALWIGTAAMRAEIERVVDGPLCGPWKADPAAVLARVVAEQQIVASPPTASDPRWRCRDPDDQMFIDLALASGACTLLTRDRALLVLARRATARQVRICTPADWVGDH